MYNATQRTENQHLPNPALSVAPQSSIGAFKKPFIRNIMELTLEDFNLLMDTHIVEVIDDTEKSTPITKQYIGSGEDVDLEMLYAGQ